MKQTNDFENIVAEMTEDSLFLKMETKLRANSKRKTLKKNPIQTIPIRFSIKTN